MYQAVGGGNGGRQLLAGLLDSSVNLLLKYLVVDIVGTKVPSSAWKKWWWWYFKIGEAGDRGWTSLWMLFWRRTACCCHDGGVSTVAGYSMVLSSRGVSSHFWWRSWLFEMVFEVVLRWHWWRVLVYFLQCEFSGACFLF